MNLWSLICEGLYCEYILGLHPAYNVLVEQGAVFYLNPPPTSRPPKNQNGKLATDALFMEYFISAEFVRLISQLREVCGLAAKVSLPMCNRTLIGQDDLATANG